MKIVLAPDSFKESMTAAEAAAAMADGVRQAMPEADCVSVPMADGGEGTAEALLSAHGGYWRHATVRDPSGRRVGARYGMTDDRTAIIEVATAIGLGLIPAERRNPMTATSVGVADLIRDALDAGATRLLIGLGGSGTVDGGAGLLAGLGVRWLDPNGHELCPQPDKLSRVFRADLTGLDPRIRAIRIDVACDVTNPLTGPEGAAVTFGPQKGATAEQVAMLDRLLSHIADALVANGTPDVRWRPGAGAAGGLGAALLVLGAQLQPGAELVAQAAGLAAAIGGADLVLTGEGSIDGQTARGKTPAVVAAIAASQGVPTIAFAGRIGPGAASLIGPKGFAAEIPILPGPATLEAALTEGPANLTAATETALRLWLLGHRGQRAADALS